MKTLYTLILTLFSISSLMAQDCSELFFSEYVEGSNNNKAVEIYNPTDAAIDLSDYRIIRWSNGNATYNDLYSVDLSGTIDAKGTFVLVLDKRNCELSGQDTCVFEGLMSKGDAFLSPTYADNRTLYHNGNDALSLNKISDNGAISYGAFVDIFAQIGVGADINGVSMLAWTDKETPSSPDYPAYTCYSGDQGCVWWTRNRTLIRKASVKQGVTRNPTSFNPAAEWDSLDINTFDRLGAHECECDPSSGLLETEDLNQWSVTVYPNPNNGAFTIQSEATIQNLEIYNISGQLVDQKLLLRDHTSLQMPELHAGTYFVKAIHVDGEISYTKMIVE